MVKMSKKCKFVYICNTARQKSNANYENLVYGKAEKIVAKNLLYDSCLTLELG